MTLPKFQQTSGAIRWTVATKFGKLKTLPDPRTFLKTFFRLLVHFLAPLEVSLTLFLGLSRTCSVNHISVCFLLRILTNDSAEKNNQARA